MYSSLVIVHGTLGAVALLAFWSAAFARKGGPLHRTVGRVFLIAMCGIGVTAIPIALAQFARGKPVYGTFLVYLVVITATACVLAWFAVRWKREPQRFFGAWHRWLAAANLVIAAAVLALGLHERATLLIGFSAIGLLLGVQMMRAARRTPGPRWWLHQHYAAMLGNGIATHVAFLSIGFGRLLPAYAATAQQIAWFGPVAAALVAAVYVRRRYGAA